MEKEPSWEELTAKDQHRVIDLCFFFFLERLMLCYSNLEHAPAASTSSWSFIFRSTECQAPTPTYGPRSCIFTRSPGDSHGLTHQATGVVDSGIWQVLFSRLMITGWSRSWASTVTTGLALQGENTGLNESQEPQAEAHSVSRSHCQHFQPSHQESA